MHDQYFKKSKRTIEAVTYRNERAMKFEKFVANFAQAVDEFRKAQSRITPF